MGVVMKGEWKGFWFRVQGLGSRDYDLGRLTYWLRLKPKALASTIN
jgi:hypothetical protein